MQLLNRYKVVDELSHNNNFTVYTICDNNNEYIIKVANINNEYTIGTLQNEVFALTRLSQYNYTPKIKEYKTDSNFNYIVYTKIVGYNLNEYKFNNLKTKIVVMINLTNIVEHINMMNIVHCDLKPNNIIIDKNGKINILDFGISQIDGNNKFKQYGTLKYSSLEKASNESIDFHEDIYSLGVILFELINENITINSYDDKCKFNTLLVKYDKRNIENRLNFIIKKCIASKINLRYNSFTELKRDLFELYNLL